MRWGPRGVPLALLEPIVLLAAIANVPLALEYLWRRWQGTLDRLGLGLEGPILADILILVVTWVPPFPWWALVLPWVLHVGLWYRLFVRAAGRHR